LKEGTKRRIASGRRFQRDAGVAEEAGEVRLLAEKMADLG
jgi:hypothetical protein